MYQCIIAALSFCSQVIRLPLFLILARKEDVVALCDWKWLSCVEGFEEIKGLACLYCSPPPVVTHCPPLQTPSTHTSSKRSNRLASVPPNTPSIPWQIVRKFPSKVPRRHKNWIVEFPKGEPFNRNGMNGNKTSGTKLFEKLGTPCVVVLFRKFWKLLFYLILEVARNLHRRFWLNGIC